MQLADTSWLVGLVQQADPHHVRAVQLLDQVRALGHGPIVVTEAAVLETFQVLESRYGTPHSSSAFAVSDLFRSDDFVPDPIVEAALRVVAENPRFGFVDALLLARSRTSCAGVLTFDIALQRALSSGTP
ncbi:MAG: PIN domain-containing protein [Coriobacteriia bacterium]